MKQQLKNLMNIAAVFTIVTSLAGCSTSKPANATKSSLKAIVGTQLIGTKGATVKDQFNIDASVAGLCGAGVYSKFDCALHNGSK